jgi:PAS domain S-box-containing protein
MANSQILVVEDESTVAITIQDILKSFGYTVPAIVCCGEEAIQKVGEIQPDLVLMDIRLEGFMDGVEAAEKIRSDFNIPVVYLTAYMDDSTVQRAMFTEPFGFIPKPFEPRELHTAVELALYKHKIEMKLKESEQLLSTVLENIDDAVISIDINGCITFMNLTAEKITCCGQKDVIGKSLTKALHVMDDQKRPLNRNSLTNILRKGVVVDFANYTRLIDKDGSEVFIESSAAPIKDAKGHITGAVLVIRDITERKQAEETLKARVCQQALVAKLGQHALAGMDLAALMDEAATVVAQSLGVEYSKVLELLPDGDTFLLRAGVGWKEGLVGHATLDAKADSEAGYALLSSEPVIVEDLRTATRFSGPLLPYDPGVVSGVSIIIPSPNRPFGVLGVYTTKRRAFTMDDIHFLQSVANILATASERKRTEESRTRLIKRVMSAQEEERRRIARELHDEIGQSLTSLLVGLRLIGDTRTLKKAKTQANQLRHITVQILDNLRRLARGLHPSILDDLGLAVALTRYAADYAQSYGIAVNVHTEGLDSSRLPSPVETALYRIAQEALTNIVRHATAKTVRIVLERQPLGVQMIVEDDGSGFDVETTLRTSTASGHLGLYGICERATLLGGSVTIESKRGQGTTVSAQIPLEDWAPIQADKNGLKRSIYKSLKPLELVSKAISHGGQPGRRPFPPVREPLDSCVPERGKPACQR